MKIVVADIGGTHARFALAEVGLRDLPRVGTMYRYRTREHADLASAWAAFERDAGEPLPNDAAVAVAAPIEGEVLRFMNSPWRIARPSMRHDLGLDRLTLLNDFGAVAHAVSLLPDENLAPVWGPKGLPDQSIISVIGPGTGLGVALLDRRNGRTSVIETEAAHIGFAPLDEEEASLAAFISHRYERASVERIVSGPGLIDIYEFLGGRAEVDAARAGELWSAAIDGSDPVAEHALDLLMRCFGAAAGDISLAHGAMGVAITGGLANRIAPRLRSPTFSDRFVAKGRYRERMHRVAVVLATYAEPGLLGAAIAFERDHLSPS